MRRREKETGGILTNPTSGTKHSTVFQKVMQSMCLFYQRNRVWLPVTETRLILAHTDRNLFESHNEQPGMDRQGLGKQPNDAVKNTGPLGLSLHCHQNIGLHVLCCCLLISRWLLQLQLSPVHSRQRIGTSPFPGVFVCLFGFKLGQEAVLRRHLMFNQP